MRLFGNGPECASIAREKAVAVRLRRKIRNVTGVPQLRSSCSGANCPSGFPCPHRAPS